LVYLATGEKQGAYNAPCANLMFVLHPETFQTVSILPLRSNFIVVELLTEVWLFVTTISVH